MSRIDPEPRTAPRPRPAPARGTTVPAAAKARRPRPATEVYRTIRAAIPFTVLPLGLGASVVAGAPWLRVYPAAVMAVPLFGAAILSVLVPVVVIGIGVRRLWLTALVDVVFFAFYTLLVGLHEPVGVADLYRGLAHGPSQILSFALPLISPRTLLVAPIALCWIGGTVLGECIGRAWHSVLPYATLLVVFALSYGGSARGITSTSDGRRVDTLLGGLLLLLLLLMRAGQAWIEQQLEADSAQSDSALPLRGWGFGIATAVVVTLLVSALAQTSLFGGPPTGAVRTPSLTRKASLTPLSFVAGLRPATYQGGDDLFSVTVDRTTSKYVAVADVDDYDGSGWSFDRTFLPSGGLLTGETDPDLQVPGPSVEQTYDISGSGFDQAPWMPFLFRPQQVSGLQVDSDTDSGMIVPTGSLHDGQTYSVRSATTSTDFGQLGTRVVPALSVSPAYTALNPAVRPSLAPVVRALQTETGVSSRDAVPFLQALETDLQTNYRLSGGGAAASRPTPAPSASPSPSTTAQPSTSAQPSANASSGAQPSTTASSGGRSAPVASTDGTGLATVLASILGATRAASPEQYATLVALVARSIGVPARVVTGFKLGGYADTSPTAAAGSHMVIGSDAWTWVEIPVQGRGWVVLDASPHQFGSTTQPTPSAPRSSAVVTGSPSTAPGSLNASSSVDSAVAPPYRPPARPGHAVAITLLVVAGIVLLVLLALAGLLVRKRLRTRRRRNAAEPRQRLVGAWQESLDVLSESGLPALQTLTSSEIAERTLGRFGDEPAEQVRRLGRSANAAIFNPSAPVATEDADAAWAEHAMLRRSVLARLSLRERLEAELRFRRTTRHRPAHGPG